MTKDYDEFLMDAFREFECEIGIMTDTEIERAIEDNTPEKLEGWLKRAGYKPDEEYEAYRRNE